MTEGEDIARTGVLVINAGDYDLASIRLVADGSVWVPFSSGIDYVEFVLQSIGQFDVFAGDRLVFSFSNSKSIEYPSFLTGYVRATIAATSDLHDYGDQDSVERSYSYYLNYTKHCTDEYPYYLVMIASDLTEDVENYQIEGGSIVNVQQYSGYTRFRILPSDVSIPLWLRYNELILFVAPV